MPQSKFLVIMPTYNEAANIEHSVLKLFEYNPSVDLLIVDDGSPDGTGKIADEIAGSNARVTVLHREIKAGLGPAYLAGFDYAFANGYEYAIEMDADGSHRAQDLPSLIASAPEYDLVIGSRWIKGGEVVNWPLHRKLISRIGNLYSRVMLGVKIKDVTAGFRIYKTALLRKLPLGQVASQGYSFQVEMAMQSVKLKAKIIEVPITFVERVTGVSKMNTAIVAEALWLVTRWGIGRLSSR